MNTDIKKVASSNVGVSLERCLIEGSPTKVVPTFLLVTFECRDVIHDFY